MKLQGIFCDAATPFDHTGSLYRTKIEHNIAKWNMTNLAGYAVGSVAGEGALLSAEEQAELWRLAAAQAPAERTLLAGILSQGVHESAAHAGRAASCGYHAVVAETPHYRRSAEVAILYYRSLADRSALPVIVANRPSLTGVDLSVEDLLAVAAHPRVAGVLECTGDIGKIARLAREARPEFAVLCGLERALWESLKAGASGAILAFSSAAPYATIALWEAFRTREEEAGIDWQARIAHPAELVTEVHGVAGLKCAMDLNGYYGGPPRLPSCAASAEARREITEAFHGLKS
ncbi:MAG: dihydrodipicolinate synthase family protein [Bryobacteraceae bacterium]